MQTSYIQIVGILYVCRNKLMPGSTSHQEPAPVADSRHDNQSMETEDPTLREDPSPREDYSLREDNFMVQFSVNEDSTAPTFREVMTPTKATNVTSILVGYMCATLLG